MFEATVAHSSVVLQPILDTALMAFFQVIEAISGPLMFLFMRRCAHLPSEVA
jgi:hypothetical protein